MKRLSIAVAVIVCIIFSSCRKQLQADGYRNVTLKNNTFAIEYWLGSHHDIDNKDSYHLYIKSDTISNFKNVIKDFFKDSYDVKAVQFITIFTDTIFNVQNVVIQPQNISGVQIHYLEDSYLKTKVYKYNKGTLQAIEALHSFVDFFKAQIVYDTSEIFNNDASSNFILVSPEAAQTYETGKANYDKNLADYKLKNK